MTVYQPVIDSYELHLANPKDILVSRCRNLILDLAIKGTHSTEFSPPYYRGVAVSLENTFVIEAASEVKLSDQITNYGDYNG